MLLLIEEKVYTDFRKGETVGNLSPGFSLAGNDSPNTLLGQNVTLASFGFLKDKYDD